MSAPALTLAAPHPVEPEVDRVAEAVERLRAQLPPREDNAVMVDLLEDDLREGLGALEELEAHFEDLLLALETPQASPLELLVASDAERSLAAVDGLEQSLRRVQKRLSQAAGRLHSRASRP